MDNNVIIRAVVDVPKTAAKLKKYLLKDGRDCFTAIQFAPESNTISASNGTQLQFLSVQFEAVERGEKYSALAQNVGFCSPKDIKAITGRRVEMVVTVNNIKGSKRVGGVWVDEVKTYYNTTFNDVNGKYICSHSVECGGYNVCAAFKPAELDGAACISVDKKAAKTLAGLLKLCALDNVGISTFAAVSVEFAAGESVAVIKSHLFSQYDNAAPVFAIDKHLLKLSTPATGGGCTMRKQPI